MMRGRDMVVGGRWLNTAATVLSRIVPDRLQAALAARETDRVGAHRG
jgi:hypothetical protein